jgi:hypothetical protein
LPNIRTSPGVARLLLYRVEPGGRLLHVLGEVRHLLHLPDLDDLVVGHGAARRPLDRLLLRADLDHPVAAQDLLRLRERAVLDPGLPPSKVTRAPMDGGCSPSSASSTPAFCSDSLYFIILATASASGTVPAAPSRTP